MRYGARGVWRGGFRDGPFQAISMPVRWSRDGLEALVKGRWRDVRKDYERERDEGGGRGVPG